MYKQTIRTIYSIQNGVVKVLHTDSVIIVRKAGTVGGEQSAESSILYGAAKKN